MEIKLKLKKDPIHVNEITAVQAKDLQNALSKLGYYSGEIDGIVGKITRAALGEFKEEQWLEYPHLLGSSTISKINEKLKDLSSYSAYLIPNIPKNPKHIIKAILKQSELLGLNHPAQQAYMLATVEWETNKTFLPVVEAYWLSEDWRAKNLRYYPWVGRGLVQITWRSNYLKYEELLGIPLVTQPDLALRVDVAVFILVHGCKHGIFTGLKIEDYLNDYDLNYYNARRVINGLDRAKEIQELAEKWEDSLDSVKKSEPFI